MRKSKRLVVKRETIRTLTTRMTARAYGAHWHDDNCTRNASGCWSGDCEDLSTQCSLDCSTDCY